PAARRAAPARAGRRAAASTAAALELRARREHHPSAVRRRAHDAAHAALRADYHRQHRAGDGRPAHRAGPIALGRGGDRHRARAAAPDDAAPGEGSADDSMGSALGEAPIDDDLGSAVAGELAEPRRIVVVVALLAGAEPHALRPVTKSLGELAYQRGGVVLEI